MSNLLVTCGIVPIVNVYDVDVNDDKVKLGNALIISLMSNLLVDVGTIA